MKFIDEASIDVQAGHGGSGARSFRREKYVPLGGPDGGNGGDGGSVILVATRNKHTLLDFKFEPILKAKDGKKGEGGRREGKSGDDLTVHVPVGTQVLDVKSRELLADLTVHGQEYIIAKGGRGGKGNDFFKSPTNRAPEHFQPGEPGQAGTFVLSLKLVADVGLIGFPNAGKSTLISRISAARPKVADYPFTTLTPNLGVVKPKGDASFVVADIPGLIPGAHEGRGLGIKFLKHVERTQVLAHLIDPNQLTEDGTPVAPIDAFKMINKELAAYSEVLSQKPQILVLTKADSIVDRDELAEIKQSLEKATNLPCLIVSSVSGEGVPALVQTLADQVMEARRLDNPAESAAFTPPSFLAAS